jgi:cyclase
MLKKRIIAVLLVMDGNVVQSIGFKSYLPIGKPSIAVEFLNQWGVDEIVLLDISATRSSRGPDLDMVKAAARNCRTPLTVGGGISSLNHIYDLMQCGADKVSINRTLFNKPDLITAAARIFGKQCLVASIDVRISNQIYQVYDYIKYEDLPLAPWDFAKRLQELGAGEVLINSVDRDGMKNGFDLKLINQVCDSVTIPIIVCGGAGIPDHFKDVLEKTKVSGIAAANLFHYFEHSVTIIKAICSHKNMVRHESYSGYSDAKIDEMGRLLKKNETFLEDLLYIKVKKEII